MKIFRGKHQFGRPRIKLDYDMINVGVLNFGDGKFLWMATFSSRGGIIPGYIYTV
jgi:hypothetical protein